MPWRPLAYAILAIIVVAGCAPRRERLYPVAGRVTLDGRPVSTGIITFLPVSGARPAISPIDEEGRYRLETFDRGDGASVGEHVVVIDSRRILNAVAPKSFAEEGSVPVNAARPSFEWIVPKSYSARDSTPLRATVAPRDNTLDFDLPAVSQAADPN